MIPKIIHYCWFGRNPMPELALKCMASWKKYCPDYEIMEWNEDTFDLASAPLYVRQAYEAKKWAFVTDFVRLQVVYEHGGIYLDTDVELCKPLDPLIKNSAYFGFENEQYINTGLGYGAEKGASILYEMMADYQEIPFIMGNGEMDLTPCPKRNTAVLLRHGLVQNGQLQMLADQICILPAEYLCPIAFNTGKMRKTRYTISIHWFSASWHTKAERKKLEAEQKKMRQTHRRYFLTHWPLLLLRRMIGMDRYLKIRAFLRRENRE